MLITPTLIDPHPSVKLLDEVVVNIGAEFAHCPLPCNVSAVRKSAKVFLIIFFIICFFRFLVLKTIRMWSRLGLFFYLYVTAMAVFSVLNHTLRLLPANKTLQRTVSKRPDSFLSFAA